MEFAVLLPDRVCSHKLELLQGKLIKLVLHLPDVGLLQLGRGLLGGGLFLRGLSKVGLLPYCAEKVERVSEVARRSKVGETPILTCLVELRGALEEARQRRLQDQDKVLQLLRHPHQQILVDQVVLGLLQRPAAASVPAHKKQSQNLTGLFDEKTSIQPANRVSSASMKPAVQCEASFFPVTVNFG